MPVNVIILPAFFASKRNASSVRAKQPEEDVVTRKGFRNLALVAGLTSIVALTLAAPADAADRGRAGAARPAGGEVTRHSERARTANGRTRHDEWTNGAGRSATRDASVTNDRDAGTRTRNVDWTGPNGRTATREDVTQRTDNGYTRDSTFTGPNGQTATREAAVVRDKEAGTLSRDVVATGPNGNTRTVDDNLQRTDSGFTRNTVATNPNGSTLTRDVSVTRDPATHTVTKDVSVEREPAPRP